jgi:hypothetical protein
MPLSIDLKCVTQVTQCHRFYVYLLSFLLALSVSSHEDKNRGNQMTRQYKLRNFIQQMKFERDERTPYHACIAVKYNVDWE